MTTASETNDLTARAELVRRYTVWEEKLRENIESLARQRRTVHRLFFGALVASAFGFFANFWFGVGTFATGLWVFCAGLYLTYVRGQEYVDELSRTRAEIDRLNHASETE
jgi:hypothetical protein